MLPLRVLRSSLNLKNRIFQALLFPNPFTTDLQWKLGRNIQPSNGVPRCSPRMGVGKRNTNKGRRQSYRCTSGAQNMVSCKETFLWRGVHISVSRSWGTRSIKNTWATEREYSMESFTQEGICLSFTQEFCSILSLYEALILSGIQNMLLAH